jgi:hypothetical protein
MNKPVRVAVLWLVVGLVSLSLPAADPTSAHSPYQGEITFRLGEVLDPAVSIDGVIWKQVRVTPRADLRSGRAVKTEIDLGFNNTSTQDVRMIVVLLFEDERGESLDRVELKPVSLAQGRERVVQDKVKIQSDVLRTARKLYLFCEVQPD